MDFEVRITGAERIQQRLRELGETFSQGSPEYRQAQRRIANQYLALTLQRFEKGSDPSRKPWAELSPVTYKYKAKGFKYGGVTRSRSVGDPGHIGLWTGDLVNSITYRIEGQEIQIGTDVPHAKYFHYGAKKGGKKGAKGGPWGEVPSRKFLGRSARDDASVIKVLERFFKEKFPELDSVRSAV